MDVLLDTNAVRGAGLAGPAFRSLREYLSRTQSALLVPAVVLEELVAQKRVIVHRVQRDLESAFRAMNQLDPRNSAAPPQLDVDAIVAGERARLLSAAENVVVLENNGEKDLPELVRRLAHRVPPASADGEEARDVLIWLAARRRLAIAPLALVTADSGFVAGSDLRPELIAELGDDSKLMPTFRTLDDFLARYHARVSSITEDWVGSQLSEELPYAAVVGAIDEHQWLFDHLVEELGEPTGYVHVLKVLQQKILSFFVSDLPGNALYVSAIVWAELEIEMEFYDPDPDDSGLCNATAKYIYPCVQYRIQLEVSEMKIIDAMVVRVKLA